MICDNLIEELEMEKTGLIEEMGLYKEKSREEMESKERASEAALNGARSQLEDMRDRNKKLETLLDQFQVPTEACSRFRFFWQWGGGMFFMAVCSRTI